MQANLTLLQERTYARQFATALHKCIYVAFSLGFLDNTKSDSAPYVIKLQMDCNSQKVGSIVPEIQW